ncbi:AlpA family phage regulatory protein [Hydrogenophaga sp.]|uniref:helix-turn-helix transcriptional regulator n=1 Tax=Hydrogenophaga sp. TaxID=1904254 RepID=UPI002D0A138F|nr:AlpA family phage regulatory protein [Hydrogenophaga sp.]HMP09195.1 AlpA family phage regulatory protein [Hydrogenophaga sp.]
MRRAQNQGAKREVDDLNLNRKIFMIVTNNFSGNALASVYQTVKRTSRHLDKKFNSISSSFPEAGGGGAAAVELTGNVIGFGETPTASDDDDGGDDDGDPDRRRSNKHPSPSGKHRNATATAGALPSPQNPEIALWRLPTVLAHVPVSRSGWWAGVKSGQYPAPVRLSARCVAWRAADIRSLVESL